MGWRRAAAPGAAPPPTNKLRLYRWPARQPRAGRRSGGTEDGQGSRSRQVQRGARLHGCPASRERRRGPVQGEVRLGAPAHLQRRAWKRLGREGAPGASSPARRPPAGPGQRPAPLARPWLPRRLRKAGFPERPEGGRESAPRPWSHPSPSLRPARDALARWRPTLGPRAAPKRPMQVEGHGHEYGDISPVLPGSSFPSAPRPPGLARDPGGGPPWQPRTPLPESCPRRSACLSLPAPSPSPSPSTHRVKQEQVCSQMPLTTPLPQPGRLPPPPPTRSEPNSPK